MSDNNLTSAGDDNVLPFQVDGLEIRGRAVQLGSMLDAILERHDYPEPVASLLAQVVVLTVLLGSSLKFDGKFSVQTQSDGPVSLLVVDFKTPGDVRAYAKYDETGIRAAVSDNAVSAPQLLGNGIMGMTIDQGANTQRYQGIVALDGSTLDEIACQYFRQSEQIPTIVKTSVGQIIEPDNNGGTKRRWRAGGLLAQFLPSASERMDMGDFDPGTPPEGSNVELVNQESVVDDAWNETLALVDTISADELTDPEISVERLLYRLFHESGVRVYDAAPVSAKCTCSREKMMAVFNGFSKEELRDVLAQSELENRFLATCEFCSRTYEFDPIQFGL